MSACTGGLMGRIFGHRFTKRAGGYVWDIDYCARCGKAAGQ